MKRDVYDRVTKWKRRYPDKSMGEAFKACRVNGPTYYQQKQKVEALKAPVYEEVSLEPLPALVGPGGAEGVRPGVVAIMGAPEDLARLMVTLARGGNRHA